MQTVASTLVKEVEVVGADEEEAAVEAEVAAAVVLLVALARLAADRAADVEGPGTLEGHQYRSVLEELPVEGHLRLRMGVVEAPCPPSRAELYLQGDHKAAEREGKSSEPGETCHSSRSLAVVDTFIEGRMALVTQV